MTLDTKASSRKILVEENQDGRTDFYLNRQDPDATMIWILTNEDDPSEEPVIA